MDTIKIQKIVFEIVKYSNVSENLASYASTKNFVVTLKVLEIMLPKSYFIKALLEVVPCS